MATAEELLRTLAIQPNPEGHIVVGGDRFITVPSNLKRLGVQYDHNMETVTFDCPRYWDNRDMSQMAVYVNYARPDVEGGMYFDRYPVDNIQADGDVMHFDWTISRNVTAVAGNVSFLVCVMKTDTDGNEERHWNSELCTECYISTGMETEEHPALEYPDEVTQLLERMLKVEAAESNMTSMLSEAKQAAGNAETYSQDAQFAAGEAEGYLDGARSTYLEIEEKAAYIRNSYAPAIKGNASGEVIRVDDVSPIDHDVKCVVHGKNRLDTSKFVITGPYTDFAYISSVNEDSIVITSTSYDNGYCGTGISIRQVCGNLTVGKSYVLTANSSSGRNFAYLTGVNLRWDFGAAMTMTDAILDSKLVFYGLLDNDGDAIISNIQIEEGLVATQYEPYIHTADITVHSRSKNLINHELMKTSATLNGVTITRNGNTLIFNGTLTTDSVLFNTHFCFHAGMNQNYTLSYKYISGGISGTASMCIGDGLTVEESRQSWANILLKHSNNQYTCKSIKPYIKDLWFYAVSGVVFSDYMIEIQLEYGDTVTDYGMYSEHACALDEYGNGVVISNAPTMTLFTDTPGAIIEAEYNVDTEKFLGAKLTDDRIQQFVDAWLTAHYTPAEGVKF